MGPAQTLLQAVDIPENEQATGEKNDRAQDAPDNTARR